MDAKLPASSLAGWGWGKSLTDAEMVIFNADGDSSAAYTYMGKGDKSPEV